MNVSQIITHLQAEGIQVAVLGDNLKVTASPGKLTADQRALIVENKAQILAFLNRGESYGTSIALGNALESAPERTTPSAVSPEYYRKYVLSNGETLQVTQEEFDNVVEVYRMLWQQDQRNSQVSKAA